MGVTNIRLFLPLFLTGGVDLFAPQGEKKGKVMEKKVHDIGIFMSEINSKVQCHVQSTGKLSTCLLL